MSADNGVYIAEFPLVGGGVEYRVTEAGAIDNCELSYLGDDPNLKNLEDAYRFAYFGGVKSFSDKKSAYDLAFAIAEDYDRNGWTLEYGVSSLKFERPIVQMSLEDVQEVINNA